MFIVYLLIGILVIYILLYFFLPKGNLLHEIVQLPVYLFHTARVDVSTMLEEKHRYGTHFRQYLLHFKPTSIPKQRNQVILYLHGGGWQFGKPEMFRANAKAFTEQGYHVFCISYRRLPFNDYRRIREDINNGFLSMLRLMEINQLGEKKICLGGMSAGAHLVALLLYDRKNLYDLGFRQIRFSGLFLCGAPLDLRQMHWTPTLYFLAGRVHSDSFKAANPVEFLQEDEQIPVLAFHGTRDGLVRYEAGAAFLRKLQSINPDIVEFHTLEAGTHLDVGTWVMEDNRIRKRLVAWVEACDEREG